MAEYDVHWCTAGVTRVEASSEKEAAALLTEYPFSDDAQHTQVVDVTLSELSALPL